MAGRYRRVLIQTWGDEKFRRLSAPQPCGRYLWLYLMTGPSTGAVPGLLRAGRAALAEDLGWTPEGFTKAFQEVFSEGMAVADWEAKLVYLPKALKHNPPASPNVIKSWRAEFLLLPECALRKEAFLAMKREIDQYDKAFREAFVSTFFDVYPEAFRKGTPKDMGESGSGTGTGAGTGSGTHSEGRADEPEDGVPRETGDPDWLLTLMAEYPAGARDWDWIRGRAAIERRIAEGARGEQLLEGMRRYAHWASVVGLKPAELKAPDVLFGPVNHWRMPWELPSGMTAAAPPLASVPVELMAEIRATWPGKPLHADWLHAERWIGRALADGVVAGDQLLQNVRAFRAQQDALGRTGSQFVPSPRKWFDGNPGPWAGPFEIPTAPTEPKRETAHDRMAAAIAELRASANPTEEHADGVIVRIAG